MSTRRAVPRKRPSVEPRAWAWELLAPRQFGETAVGMPLLADGWARIRFQYCGVCGSDLSQYEGRRPGPYPRSLGHEFVATVEAIGKNVDAINVGDIVVSDLNYRCCHCLQCKAGRTHLCLTGQSGRFTNRGFADRASLDATYLWPIRDQALHPRLALTEPLSCVLHAIEWVSPDSEDAILVLGAGSLGLCMSLAIVDRGLANSAQFWDPFSHRLKVLSAASDIPATTSAPPANAYDVVFDLTGTREGLELACDAVRRGGRLCSMSHLDDTQNTNFLLSKLTRTDVAFRVSYLNGPKDSLGQAAQLIAKRWHAGFDATIAIHSATQLPTVFSNRRHAISNKDIIDLRTWTGRF